MTTLHDRRQYLALGRKVAARLRDDATRVECGDNTAAGGRLSMELKREAFAIEWLAQREEDKELAQIKGPRRFFDMLAGE